MCFFNSAVSASKIVSIDTEKYLEKVNKNYLLFNCKAYENERMNDAELSKAMVDIKAKNSINEEKLSASFTQQSPQSSLNKEQLILNFIGLCSMKKISVLVLSLLAFQSYAEEMEFCVVHTLNGEVMNCLPTLPMCEQVKGSYGTCVARPKSNQSSAAAGMEFCVVHTLNGEVMNCLPTLPMCEQVKGSYGTCVTRPKSN